MDVPPELARFNSEAAGFLSEFEDAIDYVGGSVFDLTMNGIPSFEVPEVCVDLEFEEVCVGGWGFAGTPGLCDAIFPASQFPELRDDDGDCTIDRLVNGLILPLFEESIGTLIDVTGLDVTALVEALANLDLTQPLLHLECVEFLVDLGPDAAVSEAAIVGDVLGIGFGFHVGFDFADPVGSVDDFVQGVIEQLLAPTSVECIGLNEELFTATPDVGEPELLLTIDAPNVVDEGAPLSLVGSFGAPLPADRAVKIDWGDGTVEPITIASGETGFTVEHTYVDDDPTATASDGVEIVATDLSSGSGAEAPRQDAEQVTVRNVAPTIVSVTPAGAVEEGWAQTFTVTLDDPGLTDTHRVWVEWGDQTTSSATVAAGQRTVTLDHRYRYDNPTQTPVDTYDVLVHATDDDLGRTTGRFPQTVRNVAPSGLRVELLSETVTEGAPAEFRVLVTDHMRSVFGEIVPLSTPQDAVAVLHPDSMSTIAKFDRELFATWLNYAGGAVGSDEGGQIQAEFAEVVYGAEQVRLDPTSTERELLDAIKALSDAERVRRSGRESCRMLATFPPRCRRSE
jgi:hypothetical protein